ncbi:MAG: GtrA family protein [Paludibacteraceae bacterium]|nr:GtrA family protein [Paludibacteraceae bacterium]
MQNTFLKRLLTSQETLFQLIRYGFVGGVAFVADYCSLYAFTEWCGIQYLVSAALAFVIGLTVNYILSNLIVFTTHRLTNRWLEFAVFAIIGVIGLGLNELILYCATDLLGLHYMISKLISTALVFFWNFFARKLTLFYKQSQQ